ncbi:MAG: Fic family protein [Thermodesulfobacteriota bacterium]
MKPIGYTALIKAFQLDVLRPWVTSYLLERGDRRSRTVGGRREEFFPARYLRGSDWQDHLVFALKHEGINLEVLAALFQRLPREDLETFIGRVPTGRYSRIVWFLFEWLTGQRLGLEDLKQGNYVEVLDPRQCYALSRGMGVEAVRRQRVVNNLPGTPAYCPMVRRTEVLTTFEAERLDARARKQLQRFPKEVIYRAIQYLYVKETKSSYEIEHLQPDRRRMARFVELLRRAGELSCFSEENLVAIQQAIVEERYASTGFREHQNYVGQNLGPGRELVHYVPPRPEDLPALMDGWITCCRRMMEGGIHPVVTATIAGFGFVFMHPFEDGNGRLHRFLIHHVLSASDFTPGGMIFPVSAVMLKQMPSYDAALASYSREIMQHVEHRMNEAGEVQITNATASFYRFPDMTLQAEQLFAFVRDTIEMEFAAEIEFLAAFDAARRLMRDVVDMPDRRMDLFIRQCLQGGGRLSKNKRKHFTELTDQEVAGLEAIVAKALRSIRE